MRTARIRARRQAITAIAKQSTARVLILRLFSSSSSFMSCSPRSSERSLLQSFFSQPGEFVEKEITQGPNEPLEFSIHLSSLPLSLSFSVPPGYPLVRPSVFAHRSPALARADEGALKEQIETFITEKINQPEPEPYLLDLINYVSNDISLPPLPTHSYPAAASTPWPRQAAFAREFVWFHHIYSNEKRAFMRSLAASECVRGLARVGRPGALVVEGPADAVKRFIQGIRGLQWQKMSVRSSNTVEASVASQEEYDQFLSSNWRFPSFRECASSMADLFAELRGHGLEQEIREMIGVEEKQTEQEADDGEERLESQLAAVRVSAPGRVSASSIRSYHSKSSKAKEPAAPPSPQFAFLESIASPPSLRLRVHVKPNAQSSELSGPLSPSSAALDVRLGAPPREGAANEELIRYLASIMGVRPRQLAIKGEKSRDKTVTIIEATYEQIASKLQEAIQKHEGK